MIATSSCCERGDRGATRLRQERQAGHQHGDGGTESGEQWFSALGERDAEPGPHREHTPLAVDVAER